MMMITPGANIVAATTAAMTTNAQLDETVTRDEPSVATRGPVAFFDFFEFL